MPVRFLVTGFGQFAGVQSNPTQQLVDWLGKEHQHRLHQLPCSTASYATSGATQQHAAPETASAACNSKCAAGVDAYEGFQILGCTVLEVSAEAVTRFLEQQHAVLAEACSGTEQDPVVLLHLGVDTQRTCLNLELQAYNNAHFRCPDQAGWQPSNVCIEQGVGLGINSTRTTSLPVQQIASELRAAGFDCQVSQDAGRFVCNYTYHKSLQLSAALAAQQQQLQQQAAPCAAAGVQSSINSSACSCDSTQVAPSNSDSSSIGGGRQDDVVAQQQTQGAVLQKAVNSCNGRCYSLFVHVPSFAAVPESQQRAFLLHLMCCINKWLTTLDPTSSLVEQ